jgi:hypothetical protein
MNLKKSKSLTIESGTQCNKKSDIKLCGLANLSNVNRSISSAIQSGSINEDSLLSKSYDIGERFFYVAQKVKDNITIISERGIGYLYNDNDGCTYLKRETHICFYTENNPNPSISKAPIDLYNDDGGIIVISSTIPPTYVEALYTDNCVMASSDPFTPLPVVLNEYSLLGRLNDGIESLSLNNKDFLEILVNAICSFTKQLILKTSKLDVKRLSTPILQLIPSNNPQVKRGSLVYDDNTNTLKYYDGEKWQELVCKEVK